MSRRWERAALGAVIVGLVGAMALALAAPRTAAAHPLGNFTVNTYSRIEPYADAVRVRYVVDMAEIPAFQERQRIDRDGDGTLTEAERDAYLDGQTSELVAGLELVLDGRRVELAAIAPTLELLPGQGGLETLRLAFWVEANLDGEAGAVELAYRDGNYADRLGWREVIVGPGDSAIDGDVATDDPTNELRSYPADRLESPRVVRGLAFAFTPGLATAPPIEVALASPASGAVSEGAVEQRAGGLGGLIAPERVTAPLVVLSLLGAAAFGAVHALEPGHGKTLVAAYFVGTRGTAPQAVLLGLIVAATHTVGVFAIGVVTLVGSRYVLPEELYPWLSAASGLVLAAIGITLLRPRLVRVLQRRLGDRGEHLDDHAHAHEHEDGHHHDHDHGAHGHSHVPQRGPTEGPPWRGLIALGLADGLVPTPSTLVVLLAAVSLDRVVLGLGLIAAFSAGFGAVLTGLALVFVYARRWFGQLRWERGRPGLGVRALVEQGLPVLAGLVLVGVGLSLSARSLVDVL